MMSLRNLSRAVSRPLAQLAPRYTSRTFATVPRPSLALSQSLKAIPRPRYAAFSTTQAAFSKEGQVDQELSAKLESELQMEQQIRDSEVLPEVLAEYLAESSFKLQDKPGQEEVVLTKKFGEEDIRVTFSIADVNLGPEDEDDSALYDEPEPEDVDALTAQTGGANTKTSFKNNAKNDPLSQSSSATPSATEVLEDEDDEDSSSEDDATPSFPARLTITISKPTSTVPAVLQLDVTAQDGNIIIDQMSHLPSPAIANPSSRDAAETEYKRRGMYEGPPFTNLDEDLQVLLERYLDERGINTALALWVPEYVDWKEQKEYLRWLEGVKAFVEA